MRTGLAIGPRPGRGASVRMVGPVRLVHTPWAALSAPRKVRRVFGMVLAVSAGAMAVSASTASTDWNITQEDVKAKFG